MQRRATDSLFPLPFLTLQDPSLYSQCLPLRASVGGNIWKWYKQPSFPFKRFKKVHYWSFFTPYMQAFEAKTCPPPPGQAGKYAFPHLVMVSELKIKIIVEQNIKKHFFNLSRLEQPTSVHAFPKNQCDLQCNILEGQKRFLYSQVQNLTLKPVFQRTAPPAPEDVYFGNNIPPNHF